MSQREPRVIIRCEVQFDRLERRVVAESEDLSKRGVFVRTEELLPVGDVVELTILLPGDAEFRVICRVAHLLSPSVARALGRHTGLGFEFLEHENDGRRELMEYLDDIVEELTPPPTEVPRGCRVLIADSSGPLLERLANSLGVAGFDTDVATNGAEAYSACSDRPPGIVIASTTMPVMDGWTLVKMLTANPALRDIPVMLMDHDRNDMTRLRAYRLGVRDFITKPFTDEEITIRVRRLAMASSSARTPTLRGALSEISLPTLLSLLEFERKSGILVVLRDVEVARIFVASGRVVKIEGPDDEGDALTRVMTVLGWSGGNFEFSSCEVVGTDELGLPTTQLLIELARREDEQAR